MDGAGPYKAPKKFFHLTKSVDRHAMNDEFVNCQNTYII
jgi:hypothetical protein